MALIKLDAEQAIKVQNKHRKWPSIRTDESETLRPITRPYYEPKIKIEEHDRIFAIGSCFARQLEDACPDWLNISKPNHFNSRSQNKYNIGSVLNQIKWVYNLDKIENSFSGIIEANDGVYNDLHGHTLISEHPDEYDFTKLPLAPDGSYKDWSTKGSLEQCRLSREKLNLIFDNIKSANVIIITLGLAEIWFDLETNLVLNETPDLRSIKKQPKRFEFQQLEFSEIMEVFDEIYEILAINKAEGFKLLLTVSPIPYTSTFSPSGGAISGNCYSKSVQRAAVESFMAKHDNVGYFPSYEMAIYSDNAYVWDKDFIHVTAKFAKYILYHALNTILSDDLIDKHPDISDYAVIQYMLELLPEMGLAEMLRPYMHNTEEVKKLKETISNLTERVLNEVQSSNTNNLELMNERDKLIDQLSKEREILIEKNNALLVDKLKLEEKHK